ncbi:MAG: hypothetical protein U9N10_10085, partial [Bacillota bacterium]|nr:hypothetical protein [Bacillota bacterium]
IKLNRKNLMESKKDRALNLMLLVLDLTKEVESEVRLIVRDIGMETFFLEIDVLNLPNEVKEKVVAFKEIVGELDNIQKKEGDIYGK